MLTLSPRNGANLLSLAAAFSLLACDTARDESLSGPSQLVVRASLHGSPDIAVTTTADVADFGGAQQVADLPGPDGLVSLREAIIAADNTAGPQVIGFNIPTSDGGFADGVFTIRPLSGLPSLAGGATTIDGSTQTAYSGDTNPSGPEIVINGSLMPGPADGISISSADNRIHSLVFNGIPGPCCPSGVDIGGIEATGNVVTGCFIGTDPTGTTILSNPDNGVRIHKGASRNRVGGTTPAERNVISGNDVAGVKISSGAGDNVVQGNFIGTDWTGTIALGNGLGVHIESDASGHDLIGGVAPGAGNIISGNMPGPGILLNSVGNIVQGNFIGTDVTGMSALGNGEEGIRVNSEVGFPAADNNRIIGNLISGNAVAGVSLSSDGNVVQGNYVGTDVTGSVVIGNGYRGLNINGSENAARGNVVSGNGVDGIGIGGNNNNVQDNHIGTNAQGSAAIPNGRFGVFGDGTNHLIEQNLVSGNLNMGIVLSLVGSGNHVTRNFIGTDIAGVNPLPNSHGGIGVGDSNSDNTCDENLIAFNSGPGIDVSSASVRNTFSRNSIFLNSGLGIDLGGSDGVTVNDPSDTDAGPNNLMNFPVLSSAVASPGRLIVRGMIDTPDPATVTIEIFANRVPVPGGDPSGHGEGAEFLGTARPNPDGRFVAILPPVPPGTLISATATDAAGNTSEFSLNTEARLPTP